MADDKTELDDIEQLLREVQAANQDALEGEIAEPLIAGTSQPTELPLGEFAVAAPPAKSTASSESDLELLDRAQQAMGSVDRPSQVGEAPSFEFKDLAAGKQLNEPSALSLLQDIEFDLRIELGRAELSLEDVLQLQRGSVVALDKLAGDPVEVYVNERLVARGEVLVMNDNFCVRVTELVTGNDLDDKSL